MTVTQLMGLLSNFPSDAKVVIDVDAEQCVSDRNVLDILEARFDEVGENEAWVFIQATGDGVKNDNLRSISDHSDYVRLDKESN